MNKTIIFKFISLAFDAVECYVNMKEEQKNKNKEIESIAEQRAEAILHEYIRSGRIKS